MKKYAILPFLIFCSLFVVSYQKLTCEESKETDLVDFVRVSDLTEEMVRDFFSGKLQNIAIEFPEGSELPLKLTLKGSILAFKEDYEPLKLQFKDRVLLRKIQDEFYLSSDYQNWKLIEDYFTGDMQVGLGVKEEGPVLSFGFELNKQGDSNSGKKEE